MLTGLALLWLGGAGASELCAEDSVTAVELAVQEVMHQYTTVDEAAFDRASKQLDATVSCLDVAPPGTTVARLHEAMALVAFVNGQKVAVRRALIAARLADPRWVLDPDEFPEGHPYRNMWAAATDAGAVKEIGDADGVQWQIDGIPRAEAPVERAFLFQVLNGGEVVSTAYLYDFDDIPDLGQGRVVEAWETPYTLAMGLRGGFRVLSSAQSASGEGLKPRQAAAVGGGGELALRFTPLSFFGVELSVASMGAVDPVLGKSFGGEGHAIGLIGYSKPIEVGQPYGSLRAGYARDAVVAWPNGPDGPDQLAIPIDAFVGGLEAGFKNERLDARFVADALFAGSLVEVRGSAIGTAAVSGPLAAEVTLQVRGGGPNLVDTDGTQIGDRRDFELRITTGPTLWFK